MAIAIHIFICTIIFMLSAIFAAIYAIDFTNPTFLALAIFLFSMGNLFIGLMISNKI